MKDLKGLFAKFLNSVDHKRISDGFEMFLSKQGIAYNNVAEDIVDKFNSNILLPDIILDAGAVADAERRTFEVATKFAKMAEEAELDAIRLEKVQQAAISAATTARERATRTAHLAKISEHPDWHHKHIFN